MSTEATKQLTMTGIMHFNGRPHIAYTLGDTQYISMRPLVDQIGLDWRGQKRGLLEDDSVLFYGTLLLEDGKIVQAPCKYTPKNAVFPNHDSEKGQIIANFCSDDTQKDTVFIRLRRVQMYIARISIGHVRGRGNESSAEYLLTLQEEWADALHNYETDGIAIKSTHVKFESTRIRDFLAVCKEKRVTADSNDRKVLHSVMKEMAEKIGHPYQADLVDGE